MVDVLGFLEHVFAEHAFVHPGRGNRADMLEAAGADRIGQRDRIPRAVDVGGDLFFGAGLEVVDGGEMEEMLDLAVQRFLVGLGHAQQRTRQIAHDRDRARVVDTPVSVERLDLFGRAFFAHQKVDDGATALEQFLDQTLADESGRAGDEVSHEFLLLGIVDLSGSARCPLILSHLARMKAIRPVDRGRR